MFTSKAPARPALTRDLPVPGHPQVKVDGVPRCDSQRRLERCIPKVVDTLGIDQMLAWHVSEVAAELQARSVPLLDGPPGGRIRLKGMRAEGRGGSVPTENGCI